MGTIPDFTRREILRIGASGAGTMLAAPAVLRAQSGEPIRVGTLCPLTGVAAPQGREMQRAVVAAVERINNAGGIRGRSIRLVHEDSRMSPDAANRAAQKLIDVDRVVAIISTWESSTTLVVKPLCVRAKVFLFSLSLLDAVTSDTDHGGYVARTAPSAKLNGRAYAKFVLTQAEWKRVAYLSVRTQWAIRGEWMIQGSPAGERPWPSAWFTDAFRDTVAGGRVTMADAVIYDGTKRSYRSESSTILATNPDVVILDGYDMAAIIRELREARFGGAIVGPGSQVVSRVVESLGGEVAEGIWSLEPAPAQNSPAYKTFAGALPGADQRRWASQSWDQMTLVALALAAGRGEPSGTVIKEYLRAVSNPPGTIVHSFEEAVRLVGAGDKINYEGASGPCDFDPMGDVISMPFEAGQVQKGKLELVTAISA